MDISLNGSNLDLDIDFNSIHDKAVSKEDQKTLDIASNIIPNTFFYDSLHKCFDETIQVSIVNQVEDPKVRLSKVRLEKTNPKVRLEKAYQEAGIRDIHHPKVISNLLLETPYEEFERTLDFLLEHNVSMTNALYCFTTLLTQNYFSQPEQDEKVENNRREIFKFFIERGAKLHESERSASFQLNTLEMIVLYSDSSKVLEVLEDVLDAVDDVASIKIQYLGYEYNVYEFVSKIYTGDKRDLVFLEKYNFVDSEKSLSRKVLEKFGTAVFDDDFETVRSLIRENNIDLNRVYKGFDAPIGFDVRGEEFVKLGILEKIDDDEDDYDFDSKKYLVSPEMFQVFIEEGFDISNEKTSLFGMFPLAALLFEETKDFDYLRVLHNNGYDFNQSYYHADSLIVVLLEYAFETADDEDDPLFAKEALEFLKELKTSGSIDLRKKYQVESELGVGFANKNIVQLLRETMQIYPESTKYYEQALKIIQS